MNTEREDRIKKFEEMTGLKEVDGEVCFCQLGKEADYECPDNSPKILKDDWDEKCKDAHVICSIRAFDHTTYWKNSDGEVILLTAEPYPGRKENWEAMVSQFYEFCRERGLGYGTFMDKGIHNPGQTHFLIVSDPKSTDDRMVTAIYDAITKITEQETGQPSLKK